MTLYDFAQRTNPVWTKFWLWNKKGSSKKKKKKISKGRVYGSVDNRTFLRLYLKNRLKAEFGPHIELRSFNMQSILQYRSIYINYIYSNILSWNVIEKNPSGHLETRTCVAGISVVDRQYICSRPSCIPKKRMHQAQN